MQTQQFERFKAVLRQIVTELENIWIEAEAYRNLIIAAAIATPETLDQARHNALADPDIRQNARKQFVHMWNALDQAADALWTVELLDQLPPTDKPN
jgi:hypothetical protein